MKTKILLSLLVVIVLAACKKDKYNTSPTLTLKSTSDKTVRPTINDGILNVQLELTDKEGDISDSLYFKKIRTNKRVTATVRDSLKFGIPDPNKNVSTSFLNLDLQYENHLKSSINPGNPPAPDTLTLEFYVTDKAKNKSNVVSIPGVIVIR
jgi:hypothetical protein